MAAFAPPPVGNHTHVVAPAFQHVQPHCSLCGYRLGFLLDTQPTVQIVRLPVPLVFTNWRETRLDDVGRA